MSTGRATLEALLKLINSAAQEAMAEYEKAGDYIPSIHSPELHPLDKIPDNIVLKNAVRTLQGACAQLCTTLAPPPQTAINIVKVYDHACLRVAIKEKITNILVDHPKGIHVNELSQIVQIDAMKLSRLLRLLVARGCYTEVEPDTFANNRVSLVLHSQSPISHLVGLNVEATAKGAGVLYETLKDPQTAYSAAPEHAPVMYANNKEGITGTLFDWLRKDDNLRESYHFAMRGLNNVMRSLSFLTLFPFEKYSTFIDVGGGVGAFSLPLAKKHNHIKIILHDLSEVLLRARDVWGKECPEAIEENRIEFVEINFLTQIPVKGRDIYYLRNIIHDWPDREALLILRNVRQALGPHSRVLIHDHVIAEPSSKHAVAKAVAPGTMLAPEPVSTNVGVGDIGMYQQDLMMWILHNAKERTVQDVLELATSAGLKLEKVWDLIETRVLELSAA